MSFISFLKTYWNDVLRDVDGKFSSKRLITIGGSISIIIGYFAGLFYNFHAPDNIIEAVKWLTGGGLVTTASEQFGKKPISLETQVKKEV